MCDTGDAAERRLMAASRRPPPQWPSTAPALDGPNAPCASPRAAGRHPHWFASDLRSALKQARGRLGTDSAPHHRPQQGSARRLARRPDAAPGLQACHRRAVPCGGVLVCPATRPQPAMDRKVAFAISGGPAGTSTWTRRGPQKPQRRKAGKPWRWHNQLPLARQHPRTAGTAPTPAEPRRREASASPGR